jgi:deoxyribose-phosphate aldolase
MTTIQDLLLLTETYLRDLPPAPPAADIPEGAELAVWIDHTILKPEASAGQIEKLCAEASEFCFASVCINPVYVPLAAHLLSGSGVAVCTVIGFPLGASLPETKASETRQAIEAGATEVDMVIHIGGLKSHDYPHVLEDVQAVVDAANGEAHVKVILEMAYLTKEEKIIGCLLCKEAGADFVKTSTGFGPSGATVEDVALMRCVVGADMGVKAAGGIRTLQDAHAMIAAGATRLGASASVAIMNEALHQHGGAHG